MRNSIDLDKIRYRTLNPQMYADELPLDFARWLVQKSHFDTINQRHLRVNARWWSADEFPES